MSHVSRVESCHSVSQSCLKFVKGEEPEVCKTGGGGHAVQKKKRRGREWKCTGTLF